MFPRSRCDLANGEEIEEKVEEDTEEREIKMCLAQLYFTRRAQLLFSLLVNSQLAHS